MNDQGLIRASRRSVSGPWSPALLAVLFWLFTYLLFSLRAGLVPEQAFALASGRRLVATLAGAVACWLVLRRIESARSRAELSPLAVLASLVPAALFVLAARLIFDQLYPRQAVPLGENLRWTLFWSGYFGIWVALALAHRIYRRQEQASAWSDAMAPFMHREPFPPEVEAAERIPEGARPYDWLVDAIAREAAGAPRREREEMIERLLARAGYAVADAEFGGDAALQNARADLVYRVAARLAEGGS